MAGKTVSKTEVLPDAEQKRIRKVKIWWNIFQVLYYLGVMVAMFFMGLKNPSMMQGWYLALVGLTILLINILLLKIVERKTGVKLTKRRSG